jgi:hypothetical protein
LSVPRESLLPPLDLENFGERFADGFGAFVVIRAAFFDVDLLAEILRVAFALRAAGLFAGAFFFFFDLAIIREALTVSDAKNGGLIKNISPKAQAEILRKDLTRFRALNVDFTSWRWSNGAGQNARKRAITRR